MRLTEQNRKQKSIQTNTFQLLVKDSIELGCPRRFKTKKLPKLDTYKSKVKSGICYSKKESKNLE